ncbi:MAG: alpha/beta hydrolase [Bacteroidota bacterium]
MYATKNYFNYFCKMLISALLLCQVAIAQNTSEITNTLLGNWEGAFIKNNSYQKIEIEFSKVEGKLYGLQIMDEWHPTFGEFQVPVEIDSTGTIKFGTGYGKAMVTLDKNNLELVGQLEKFNPTIYMHLKKKPKPPKPNYSIESVRIPSDAIELQGHIHIPKFNQTKVAVILVDGRGCFANVTQYNLYAKFLRTYGITVLAYQKRGTGASGGDCGKATIDDLANDVKNVKKYLEAHPIGFEKIGVLGISAGGWTMVKAEEMTDFDFMISIVGPATSVKDQQLQSMEYGAEEYQLTEQAKNSVRTYTNLVFDAKATQKGYQKMQDLLAVSEKEGWKDLLEDTDIPNSVEGINNLWVRRHNFDPKQLLSNYQKPFLAIYGDRDFIVPYKENTAALETYFGNRKNLLTTVIAYNAEHGMETQARNIDLGNDQSYWHFYRISPQVCIEIVNFLKKHSFIE